MSSTKTTESTQNSNDEVKEEKKIENNKKREYEGNIDIRKVTCDKRKLLIHIFILISVCLTFKENT